MRIKSNLFNLQKFKNKNNFIKKIIKNLKLIKELT